jgi:uncharacterized tellurite resistance protein B-like protein
MIKKLTDKISRAFAVTDAAQSDADARELTIRMATAVLMTEVARADYEYDESEFELLLNLITHSFHISPEDAAELANQASETADEHFSLHNFTHLLNKNLSAHDKGRIVSLLWQVAYADGRLDKYEDSLVLKISDLLHVSRGQVMRLKHDANPQASDG